MHHLAKEKVIRGAAARFILREQLGIGFRGLGRCGSGRGGRRFHRRRSLRTQTRCNSAEGAHGVFLRLRDSFAPFVVATSRNERGWVAAGLGAACFGLRGSRLDRFWPLAIVWLLVGRPARAPYRKAQHEVVRAGAWPGRIAEPDPQFVGSILLDRASVVVPSISSGVARADLDPAVGVLWRNIYPLVEVVLADLRAEGQARRRACFSRGHDEDIPMVKIRSGARRRDKPYARARRQIQATHWQASPVEAEAARSA